MQLQMKANWDVVGKRLRATEDLVTAAMEKAIAATAFDMLEFNKNLMKQSFDRPMPYTLNGFFARGPRQNNGELKGGIYAKEYGVKGTPAYKYLMPNIDGGPRRYKRHEKLLKSKGILPGGMMTAPGKHVARDWAGNISGGTYTSMLAQLDALTSLGENMRSGKGRAKKPKGGMKTASERRYFILYKAGRPVAVMERNRSNYIRTMLNFITPVNYQKRYPFYDGNQHFIKSQFPLKFYRILRAEIRKYRPV